MQEKLHFFSIIIPAYNEEGYIAECIRSLRRQDYPGKFEIIVVDNASTDKTADVAEKNGAQVIQEEKKGVSRARRLGFAKAKGEIIACTDADSRLPPDWLSRLNHIFNSDKNIAAAGGFFRFDEVGFAIDLVANKIFLPINSWFLKYIITPRTPFLTGSNMAVRKDAYEKSGGFDPKFNYGEDNELAKRISRIGSVFFDSDLIVKTSFRRYSGGHKNILFVLLKSIKEAFVTILRFAAIKSGGKAFSAQPAIREKNSGTGKKKVALTFDDGPYGKPTEKILDILKEKNVKATFFILGWNAKKYPETIKREVAEGHIVGNHSFSHSRFLFLRSLKKIFAEIEKANAEIRRPIGLRPRFYRAPYGYRTPWMPKTMASRGFEFIPVGILAGDWNATKKPEDIAKKILKKIRPGSIITLHDGRDRKINYSRENVVKALPHIIDGIRIKGFEIVPLDQLVGKKAYF